MERREARRLLAEIRVGKRYCRLSHHFEEALDDEDLSIEHVWQVLKTFNFKGDPEGRGDGSWRVRGATSSAETTAIIPIPMLNVRYISDSSRLPACFMYSNTGRAGHVPRSTRAPVPRGSVRGRLSVIPPPVM